MQTFEHLNRQIAPEAHTAMYNFHKYWSRKTWNVVGKFIENYSNEGEIVFDPFGGSGVTALEALKHKRRAIICDLSPLSTELIRLTIKPVNLNKLLESYYRIEKAVKEKILELYRTECKKCKTIFPFTCAIWKKNKCESIRYYSCPQCGDNQEGENPLTKFDKEVIKKIDDFKIPQWYPKNPLYHISGRPFMKKEKFESVDQLFTKRNLYALAILMEEIEKEPNTDIKSFLKIGFSSILHLCTSMTPVRPTRPMSSAWTEHSYWHANEFMEQNVWEKFESGIIGKQGLIKAKEESNQYYKDVKFATSYKQVIDKKADVYIYTGSCIDLMKKMGHDLGGCVDYIFTDPPYGSSIQYGELSYMWIVWLKMDDNYLNKMASDEIIHNEKQDKGFNTYHSLLKNSFERMFDVIKPKKYLTVTFHNPTFKVRNATIRASVLSGFELQKIHHQELARPSAKSLLQPFGSAQGDFYLRFYKPSLNKIGKNPEEIDEARFIKIVVETTIMILAERGDPTPYTIIINAIDPELAKRGFFAELDTGLNVETVLKDHLDKEFILVDAVVGGVSGKMWWLKNPKDVKMLESIPLSERVDETVLRQLQSKGRVTFTDIWEAVSTAFPNSLTSDQSSIKTSLESYAKPVQGGFWLIKKNFKIGESEKEHTTIIAILAEIGLEAGYKIYVGVNEQSHEINSLHLKDVTGRLNKYMNYKPINKLKNIINADIVDDIDLLWIKDNEIKYLFEIESTTSMTSALQRGSCVNNDVPKIMLFPHDRENQFRLKMKTPMFNERFISDKWSYILFENLYAGWNKQKKQLSIESIAGKNYENKITNGNESQLKLF